MRTPEQLTIHQLANTWTIAAIALSGGLMAVGAVLGACINRVYYIAAPEEAVMYSPDRTPCERSNHRRQRTRILPDLWNSKGLDLFDYCHIYEFWIQ